MFAGRVKIVSHSSCRTSAVLKYFCPLSSVLFYFREQLEETICHENSAGHRVIEK